MPKSDDTESIISETGNWNVADAYSKSKIMRPLILCDYYEDIAIFGYDSLVQELQEYTSPPNDLIRYKALNRLFNELFRVIDNSKFALKRQGTKKEILGYRDNLVKLSTILPKLITKIYDPEQEAEITKIINVKLFDDIISKVSLIKSKINEPLNRNHLIFTDKEEFDPRAFKDKIRKRITEHG